MSDEKNTALKKEQNKGGGKTVKKEKYKNPFSYEDALQSKFVNSIMKNGKKSVAQRILKNTFDEIYKRSQKAPQEIFETALAKVTPTMEVKPKRVGGAIYQIPMEVPPKRQQTLAIRWIREGARSRKGIPMYKRLATELLEASNESGYAFNRKEELFRMAQANKAFAHFARY